MRRFLATFALILFASISTLGCNAGAKEEAPPDSAPEMSAEEKKKMEDGIKKQKEMMKKYRSGGQGPN